MSNEALSPAVAASSRIKVDMSNLEIRQVWDDNFDCEMDRIETIKKSYPYIAVSTISAGGKVETEFGDSAFNIMLKTLRAFGNYAIQIGLCLSDRNGNLPCSGFNNRYLCWELNVGMFDIESETAIVDEEHVQRLIDSDIEFGRLRPYGIQSAALEWAFKRMEQQSTDLPEKVNWIPVNGAYDLGHILNLLVPHEKFPVREYAFLDRLIETFTRVYDLSHMASVYDGINVNPRENEEWLDHAAECLGVVRVGNMYRAGSDALLGALVFHQIKKRWTPEQMSISMGRFDGLRKSYRNVLPGYPDCIY